MSNETMAMWRERLETMTPEDVASADTILLLGDVVNALGPTPEDSALETVLDDLGRVTTADVAASPHDAICRAIVAVTLIGRRFVPAKEPSVDATMPGKRSSTETVGAAFTKHQAWSSLDGSEVARKDADELAQALSALEVAKIKNTALRDMLAARNRTIEEQAQEIAALRSGESSAGLGLGDYERRLTWLRNTLIQVLGLRGGAFDAEIAKKVEQAGKLLGEAHEAIAATRRTLETAVKPVQTLSLPDLAARAASKIAALADEHHRERTAVDELRRDVADVRALRVARLEKIERDVAGLRRDLAEARDALEQAWSLIDHETDGAPFFTERSATHSLMDAFGNVLTWYRQQVADGLAGANIIDGKLQHERRDHEDTKRRLAAAMVAERRLYRDNVRCADLIEHVRTWAESPRVAMDQFDHALVAAFEDWQRGTPGPSLAEQLRDERARWQRIQPMIKALHKWDGGLSHGEEQREVIEQFEAWQKAEAAALEAEEGVAPTPALRSLFGGPTADVPEPVGGPQAFTPDDEPRRLTRADAIEIARRAAAGPHRPGYFRDEPDWMPHEWVIDAMMAVSEAPRTSNAPPRQPDDPGVHADSSSPLDLP